MVMVDGASHCRGEKYNEKAFLIFGLLTSAARLRCAKINQ
jgi:hypothetical protein